MKRFGAGGLGVVQAGAMMLRLPSVLVLILAALPAQAQAQEDCPRRRNVDCAGAARAVDAAIADDPWLAILDRARAMRLAELTALLGPESAAELARQDAAWRRSLSRDLAFRTDGALDEPDPRAALRGGLEYRLMRLMRLQPDPAADIDGIWAGVQGLAVVSRVRAGQYRVSVGTADVNNLAWLCEYDGAGETQRVEWMETDDGAVELRRIGTMLHIRMLSHRPSDFCGAGGNLGGYFFREGDAPP